MTSSQTKSGQNSLFGDLKLSGQVCSGKQTPSNYHFPSLSVLLWVYFVTERIGCIKTFADSISLQRYKHRTKKKNLAVTFSLHVTFQHSVASCRFAIAYRQFVLQVQFILNTSPPNSGSDASLSLHGQNLPPHHQNFFGKTLHLLCPSLSSKQEKGSWAHALVQWFSICVCPLFLQRCTL